MADFPVPAPVFGGIKACSPVALPVSVGPGAAAGHEHIYPGKLWVGGKD